MTILRYVLPAEQRLRLQHRLERLRRPAWFGTIGRTTPVSDCWGHDRGTPVDRYYIERFLSEHRQDIRGRVLEVQESYYADLFGSGVERAEVLDIDSGNPNATIIADLSKADSIPSESFDCFILTKTLQYIYDLPAAIAHARRILRPGGVLLVTVPTLSKLEAPPLVDYWRFTAAGCRLLFGQVFGAENITIRSYGNVLTGIASLEGLAYEELSERELQVEDYRYQLIVTVRAVKR